MKKIFLNYLTITFLTITFFVIPSATCVADVVYESPEHFITECLNAENNKPSVLWLDKKIQMELKIILGHEYPQARIRYWQNADKYVWILEEIGKEYPITAGFLLSHQQIERAQVLIYRETRGDEIHLPQFLAQFRSEKLVDAHLNKSIDGISGATLSVNAMKKMAQAALYLDSQLSQPNNN